MNQLLRSLNNIEHMVSDALIFDHFEGGLGGGCVCTCVFASALSSFSMSSRAWILTLWVLVQMCVCMHAHMYACTYEHAHHSITRLTFFFPFLSQYTEAGVVQLEKAKDLQKKVRKKMCFLAVCLSICILIGVTFVWNFFIPHF